MDYNGSGGYDGASMGGGSGGGGGYPSPSQPKGKRNYDDRTVTPVTVSMALTATTSGEGGSVELSDGRKVNQISIVGATRTVEDFSTNVLYNIEDGTGLVEVKQWLDDNDSSGLSAVRKETLREHVYLKVIGNIRDYDGKKTIVADAVKPLTTANELTHHMLSVIYSAESHKRKHSYVIPSNPMMGGVGFAAGPTPTSGATASFHGMDMGGAAGLHDIVLNYIKTRGEQSEAGANLQECVQALTQAGHSDGAIRKAIDDLNNEGHIYSTIDDNNFKAAM
jgi:replication factor A2